MRALVLFVLLIVESIPAAAQVVPPFDVTPPLIDVGSQATAVNINGQIVGYVANRVQAFSWSLEKGLRLLPTLGSTPVDAVAVNAAGLVIGTSNATNGRQHAYVWNSQTGQMTDLGARLPQPATNRSFATGINDDGYVVGRASFTNGGLQHAIVWFPDGSFRDLGLGLAVAINARGQVAVTGSGVGECAGSGAYLWNLQTQTKVCLGSFGAETIPVALNDNGQVVGQARVPATNPAVYHAFSWTQAAGIVDLGTLGGKLSAAVAVNSSGMVVGNSDVKVGFLNHQHAFKWTRVGGMKDLGTLGGLDSMAFALNAKGQIAGVAQDQVGKDRGVVWSSAGNVELGTLGGPSSRARAINDNGLAVGSANTNLPFISPTDTHAAAWVTSNAVCENSVTLAYAASTLNLDFRLRTAIPGTWTAWLALVGPPEKVARLWSAPIPIVPSVATPRFSVPNVPPVGPVYALTALATPEALCTGYSVVNTGP